MLFVYSYIRVASDMNKNDDKASNVSEYRCHKAYAMNLEKKQGYNSITCEPQPLAISQSEFWSYYLLTSNQSCSLHALLPANVCL